MRLPLKQRMEIILNDQGIKQADLVKVAGVSKGLVSQWLNGQTLTMGYDAATRINRRWGYTVDWLINGGGRKFDEAMATTAEARLEGADESVQLSTEEEDLIARYRSADARWRLCIRLLSYVATEEQNEVAGDVNVILARVFGKRPRDIRPVSNKAVAAAYGDAPHVAARKKERAK